MAEKKSSGLREAYDALEEQLQRDVECLRKRSAHRTERGDTVELFLKRLLTEHVPCGYEIAPGHVLNAGQVNGPGHKFDLVLYDPTFAKPLFQEHNGTCYFAYESVVGVAEATVSLDRKKLRHDLERLTELRNVALKAFYVATGVTAHDVVVDDHFVPPRCFMFAAEPGWKEPLSFAKALQEELAALGENAFVHYVWISGWGLFTVGARSEGYPIRRKEGASLIDFAHEVAISLHRFPLRPYGKTLHPACLTPDGIEKVDAGPAIVTVNPVVPVYPFLNIYFERPDSIAEGFTELLPGQGTSSGASQSSSLNSTDL